MEVELGPLVEYYSGHTLGAQLMTYSRDTQKRHPTDYPLIYGSLELG